MADSADPTGPPNRSPTGNSLRNAFDAGFLSSAADDPPRDTPDTAEIELEATEESIESAYSGSDTESSMVDEADLAANLRVFSESMLRMELAELEMIKAREARRLESERRKLELEAELTQMMMRNQLLIASFLSQKTSYRKRKRSESDDAQSIRPENQRDGAIFMGLLHCNMI